MLAIDLLEDPAKRDRRTSHAAALPQAMRLDLPGRFDLAEAWSDEEDLEERLSTWLLLLGGAVRSSAVGAANREQRSARRAIDAVVGTLEALRRNANARLALETMMLDLPPAAEGWLSTDAEDEKRLD